MYDNNEGVSITPFSPQGENWSEQAPEKPDVSY